MTRSFKCGHPRTPANSAPSGVKQGKRQFRCRTCLRLRDAEAKRRRRASDPNYAEAQRLYARERYRNDASYRDRQLSLKRDRWRGDGGFRLRRREYNRKWYRQNAEHVVYSNWRRSLRTRVSAKRERVAELEKELRGLFDAQEV